MMKTFMSFAIINFRIFVCKNSPAIIAQKTWGKDFNGKKLSKKMRFILLL